MKDYYFFSRYERRKSVKIFCHALLGTVLVYFALVCLMFFCGIDADIFAVSCSFSLSVSSWWFLHLKNEKNRLLHVKVMNSKNFAFMRDLTIFVTIILFVLFLIFWFGDLTGSFGTIILKIFRLFIGIVLFGAVGILSCLALLLFNVFPGFWD